MMKSKFRVKVILSMLITVAVVLLSGVTVFMFFERSVTAVEQGVLRVAGWDVYADPEHKNKTIGFRNFEDNFDVQVEFKPLDHPDAIVDFPNSTRTMMYSSFQTRAYNCSKMSRRSCLSSMNKCTVITKVRNS